MDNNKENLNNRTAEGNEGAGAVETQTTENKQNEGKAFKTFQTEEEYQNAVDSILKKKLPPKEEMDAFKKWQESQKTDDDKKKEEIIKNQNLQNDNDYKTQLLEIIKNGRSYEEAEFIQFKLSKMEGDFEENLSNYLKNNPIKDETKKNETTGFSQNNSSKGVSEEKAYLDKKYANNPYYKK